MISNGGLDPVSVWRSDIAELRKQARVSVRDLAVKTGYSSTYCGYAINGPTIPAWNVCEAVLVVLGVEPAEWIPRWQAARRAQGQPAETGLTPGMPTTAADGGRDREEPETDDNADVAGEAAAGAVIHNSNHVSVVINPPADGDSSLALPRSSSSGRTIRILGPTATRWTVGTGAAVALVAALAIGNSGGGQPASAPAAASAPVTTIIQATRRPSATESSASTRRTATEGSGTSSEVAEPGTATAAPSPPPTPPTASAVASSAANGAGTDPATGTTGGHCKQVIGEDVRVFANPQDTQQVWVSWRRGTLFWAVVGRGTSDRYATSLRDGRAAWITKDSRYVVDANGCP